MGDFFDSRFDLFPEEFSAETYNDKVKTEEELK
jgi:hypothetical protein